MFLLFIAYGIFIAILYRMRKKRRTAYKNDKQEDDIESQNELSSVLLTFIIAGGGAVLTGSEIIFGAIRKLYRANTLLVPLAFVLLASSCFFIILARWVTDKNIRNKSSMSNYERAYQKKCRYNTIGIALFFISLSIFIVLAAIMWLRL